MKMEEMAAIAARGKALGLIRGPGAAGNGNGKPKAPVIVSACAPALKSVRVNFMEVHPDQARAWLAENNGHNRRMRGSTVAAYARDMVNGDWLLNHQGIAFDELGNLIDGQHRLAALVEANRTMVFLVSTGWPARQTSERNQTMDTVDRGVNRTVADQLGLQHGITDARYAVTYATVIAKLCRGTTGTMRMSTALTLGVIEQFGPGIKFAVEFKSNANGLRGAGIWGAIAFAQQVFPHKVKDFVKGLLTGSGLSEENPILPFRNWVTVGAGSGLTTGSNQFNVAAVCLNHIQWSAQGKTTTKPCLSLDGLKFFVEKQEAKVAAVRKLCGMEVAA